MGGGGGESTQDKDSMGKANVQIEQEAKSEKTQNTSPNNYNNNATIVNLHFFFSNHISYNRYKKRIHAKLNILKNNHSRTKDSTQSVPEGLLKKAVFIFRRP